MHTLISLNKLVQSQIYNYYGILSKFELKILLVHICTTAFTKIVLVSYLNIINSFHDTESCYTNNLANSLMIYEWNHAFYKVVALH